MYARLLFLGLALAAAGCVEAADDGELLARSPDGAVAADTANLPILRRIAPAANGNHDYGTGRPSRDGRTLPYVDWTTGDVAVYDFVEGRSRPLTGKGSWGQDGSWAENAVASPDGSQIAFLYGNVNARQDANFLYELRVADADGADDRVLVTLGRGEVYYAVTDWSERHGILVERNYHTGVGTPPDADLATLDPRTGEAHVIIPRSEGLHPHTATFSPDDELIAAQVGRAVVVYDMAGREIARAPWGFLVGWTPSGGGIVTYGRARSGESGFWHLAFDGRSLGEPQLVRGSVYGARPLGSAGDRYFYTVTVDAPQVEVGRIDIATGTVASTPVPVGTAAEGGTDHPAWSPDGRSLAYLRRTQSGEFQLMVRSADGGEVRMVTDIDVPQPRSLDWHPDGEALYFIGRPQGWKLFRVDLRRGEVSEAVDGVNQAFALAPDGSRVYARRHGDDWWGGRSGIAAVDVATGEELWFREGSTGPSMTALPDGRVVFTEEADDGAELVSLDPEGGDRRVHARVSRPDFISPNGQLADLEGELLYTIWRDAEGRRELWTVPTGGGEPRRISENVGPRFTLHPDGRRFAVQGGEMRHEIWVMEGVEEALVSAGTGASSQLR